MRNAWIQWTRVMLLWAGLALMANAQLPGSLDPVFDPVGTTGGRFYSGREGGKVLVSGGTLLVGAPVSDYRAIARFNSDGTVDPGFSFPGSFSAYSGHVIRSDGRILLYGAFTSVGGHPTKGVVLLQESGAVDVSFRIVAAGSDAALAVAPLPDSACYVAYASGVIVRVDSNGAIDPGFNVNPPLGNQPLGIAVQPSGQLLVLQNGRVIRLKLDGSKDTGYVETTFTGLKVDPGLYAMAPDGSLYISSNTGVLNSTEFRTVVRLLPQGGVDPGFRFALDGFTAGQRNPTRIALEQSGRLLVTGVNFNPAFVRVLPSGALDSAFSSPASPTSFGFDQEGRILLSGSFLQTSPTVVFRIGLMRLNNDNAPPPPGPPVILTQPVAQTVRSGQAVTFSVLAGGDQPISFQWRSSLGEVAGAVSNRWTISPVRRVNGGVYDVVVSNPQGSITSTPVSLEVITEPFVVKEPMGFTASEGAATNLIAIVDGEPPIALQWFLDGNTVPGADAATLPFPAITPAEAGAYRLVASNGSGSVTSAPARVTVLASKPEWLVITNVTTATTLADAANPYRPDSALKVRHDGERGAVVLYPNALERWNDAGQRQWTIRYEEADFGRLEMLALDRDGNAYVGGKIHFTARLGDLSMTNHSAVTGPNGHVQAFIAKIDPTGHGLWYRLYEAAGPSLRDIAVDTDGGVVFAAGSGGRNGFSRLGPLVASESEYASAVVGKLTADGTPVFFRAFPQYTVNKSTCEASAITADETGIYVAGLISFSIQFGNFQLQNVGASPGNWIGKLDASGEPKWIQAAGGLPSQGAPLASAGGKRWFLLPRDRVLQSWSPDGALLTNVSAVIGSQNDSALVSQLSVTTNGSPMLIGNVKGDLTVAGTSLTPGSGRPAVWFGLWNPDGLALRGRILAVTTNANVNSGGDTVSATVFAATAGGDALLAGQYLVAMRFLGTVYVSPPGSVRPDGWIAGAFLAKIRQPAFVPEISQQPIAAYELGTGDTVKIGIRAIGPEPLTYQWRRNGIPVPGATTNSYEFVNATVADTGLYDVVVTNPFGSVLTESARITVRPPFTIRTPPSPQLVLNGVVIGGAQVDSLAIQGGAVAGKLLKFTITNTTSARFPLGGVFDLRLNGGPSGGTYAIQAGGVFPARQSTYSVPFSLPDHTNLRFLRFDGVNMATLGLSLDGQFDLHYDIADPDGCCATGTFTLEGGSSNASFQVVTSFFVPDGNFQWQRNGVDLPGKTSSTLSLTNVTAAEAGMYRVIITDRGYTETSVPVELRVLSGAPLDPPVLNLGVFVIGTGGMTIPTWPTGHVLQRTLSLSPPAWETIATQPPVTIPFSAPGEFFQLVPGP